MKRQKKIRNGIKTRNGMRRQKKKTGGKRGRQKVEER